jgi:hypothetical protein
MGIDFAYFARSQDEIELRKRVAHLEELVCIAYDYLCGHYNMSSQPIREISKEMLKIRAREKRTNAIQGTEQRPTKARRRRAQ